MFDHVLKKAKGNNNDLGRVIINHPELNNPVVVPLDKWSKIDSANHGIAEKRSKLR